MKLMIASDLHGSFAFAKRLADAYAQEKADKLLLLGDLLYHGPRNDLPLDYAPKKVIALLNAMAAVRGTVCPTFTKHNRPSPKLWFA